MSPVRPAEYLYLLLYLVLFLFIVLVSATGDYLLKSTPRRTPAQQYGIALMDTSIHGAIGALSWAMFVVLQLATLLTSRYCHWSIIRDIFLCGLLSSAIDIDHVIAAQSLSIKSLTSLTKRPMFHNTTTLLAFSIILILLGYNFSHSMSTMTRLGYLLLVATISHHIRDALRRGLLLWPLLTRPLSPVPLPLYYAVLFLLPIVLHLLAQYSPQPFGYHSNSSQVLYSMLNPDAPLQAETVV